MRFRFMDWSPDGLDADLSHNVENDAYKSWLATFNVENAKVPDTFINALLRHVCDGHTRDKKRRIFWRVRRLQEQPHQQAEPEGTVVAVPVRAEQIKHQSRELWDLLAYMTPPYASTPLSDAASSPSPLPLLPPMDSSLGLHHTAESTRPHVTSVDVALADTLLSHRSYPHAAAKEEATSVTTQPLTEGTAIPPQSLAIEPVIEELAALSVVDVDVGASLAAHPVDGLREDGSLARPQLVERDIAPMGIAEPSATTPNVANAESIASAVVPASIRSGPVEETARSSLTVDNSEKAVTFSEGAATSRAGEANAEVVQAVRDEQSSYGHVSLASPLHPQPDLERMVGLEGVPVNENVDNASRMGFGDALAIPGHALVPMGESVSQRGMTVDSEQPIGAAEDEDEEPGS
ncbi:hypothetical protein EIP86_010970 [Pleurotus ostreatoroseus]|nr:hypothetical protein EIP86_010970 [Pleurotus ostreatoroseus]